MATIPAIRAILLEEAILYLLRWAGYQTVTSPNNDDTLGTCPAGLLVNGRGCSHQIDAIADFRVAHPFSHRQRLLVEAKCYNKPIAIEVIRNAVGVLKDVAEFWATASGSIPVSRYHYQYSVFSSSRFTDVAQRFAFAHDIHLMPLGNSTFFQPIIRSIQAVTESNFGVAPRQAIKVNLTDFRQEVRAYLADYLFDLFQPVQWGLEDFYNSCRSVGGAILGMIQGAFPVFLVPRTPEITENLGTVIQSRITRRGSTWYLKRGDGDEDLFSFELPDVLFDLYMKTRDLRPLATLDFKQQYLSYIQAFVVRGDRIRLLTFELDQDWIAEVRQRRAERVDG